MVLVHVSVVQLPPLRDFLYYVADSPLLGSLAVPVGKLLRALLLCSGRGLAPLAASLGSARLAQIHI